MENDERFFYRAVVVTAIFLIYISFDSLIEVMAIGFIIVPLTVLYSLNTEANQMEAFLHNPHSVYQLLLVKFFYGFLSGASLLLVLIDFIASYGLIHDTFNQSVLQIFGYLLFVSGQMLVISLYPAVILVFLWTLHHLFKTYIGGGISIVIIVILLVIGSSLMNMFWETATYDMLTQWGKAIYPYQNGHLLSNGFGNESIIYLGKYVFYAFITIILFSISAYLIDRKVEV
ncbi:hypothetical protein F3157_03050 [Virgibacillus dakarensis]|nr:hypothetical protein [Virgibacillus dakarensis]